MAGLISEVRAGALRDVLQAFSGGRDAHVPRVSGDPTQANAAPAPDALVRITYPKMLSRIGA